MACNETGAPRPASAYEVTGSAGINIIRELHPGNDLVH
jgi:hypothetical protein